MTYRSLTRFVALAVLAAFAASARAQDPSTLMGNNCMMQQFAQLCPGAKPGTPDFSACAKQHSGEAMTACQKSSSDASAASTKKQLSDASPCADDAKKFCPGKWPGTPEFSACMHSHIADVTPACAAWGKKREGMKHKAGDDVCVGDAKKLCPGLTVMDGSKFTSCMTKNYDSLSPDCQTKFKGLKGASTGEHGECMAALQKLCPDLQPGDSGGMMQCMMAHRDEMPASCHKHGK